MEERFEKHRKFLVDRIDPDFGLLDKLLASKTLTREAVHEIQLRDNTTERKNRILLDFILKDKKADELITALRDSGQIHLVNYLNADGEHEFAHGDDWPLSETEISLLDINRESLVDLLDTSDLCIRLFSQGVINNRQKQLILSKVTDSEKNETLLDIFTKFSLRQYNTTVVCLYDSNQSHIAELLSNGGVLVRVHANLEGAIGNVDELEEEIISQLTRVLEDRPVEEVTRLLDLTKRRIIAARKGQSVVIYIISTTHNNLLQLIDQLKSDRLKDIIERVFNEILSTGDALRITLTWSAEEFHSAANYFGELQEKYKLDPVLIQTIRQKSLIRINKAIQGLTILEKELFVLSEKSSDVEVYDSMTFNFSRRWNLMELINPLGVGSCNRNKCLYIFDMKGDSHLNEILRVDPYGKLIRNWSTGDDFGWGLSVTRDSNVILAVFWENKLNKYSSNGQLIREINLPTDAGIYHPLHAVELTNGQFVVSHGIRRNELHGVCIVDGDGQLKKSFGEKCESTTGQMNGPAHLSVDGNGFVMVADRFNSRVLLLDSELEFEREILSKAKHGLENPMRILLDEANGRLLVADNEWNKQRMTIFQFRKVQNKMPQ